MLELKNISKIYKPKKGEEVRALDNINLKFPDKGMVFVVGKSGSGKSTLLNIIGGLDQYSDGDLIIKGKSTKMFKQVDFDSYRNTMIGFIFQEYNVLDEFTIAQNIGLALELQGKKATSESVSHILNQVDLEGFSNRKPNELSGGQKQRVAIARALIKDPEIIMADEPTGALDSTTGKQVFDTLKKLSKDKLVIIISHDLEFAKTYGDRVIEFKDGHIISDETRVEELSESKEKIELDDDQIIIEKGYQLTIEDLKVINEYLLKIKDTTPLIKTAKSNNIKQGKFVKTDDTKIVQQNDSYQLIKSKLPFAKSLRMGASSLKHKKVRLVFSIILAAISFVFLGLSTTASFYNKQKTALNSIKDNTQSLFVRTSILTDYGYKTGAGVTKKEYDYLKKLNTNSEIAYVFNIDSHSNYYQTGDMSNERYYTNTFSGAINLTKTQLDKLGWTLTGRMPSNKNEVVISDLTFEGFVEYGYLGNNNNNRTVIFNENDMLNKKIKVSEKYSDVSEVTIVGVVNTHLKDDRYESIKRIKNSDDFASSMKLMEYSSYLQSTPRTLLFVSEEKVESLLNGPKHANGYIDIEYANKSDREYGISKVKIANEKDVVYFDGYNKNNISNYAIFRTVSLNRAYGDIDQNEIIVLFDKMETKDIYDELKYYQGDFNEDGRYNYIQSYISEIIHIDDLTKTMYDDIKNAIRESYIKQIVNEKSAKAQVRIMGYNKAHFVTEMVDVVGVSFENNSDVLVATEAFIKDNFEVYEANALVLLSESNIDQTSLKTLVKTHYSEDNPLIILSPSVTIVDFFNEIIEVLSQVFLWAGVVFAVFASLLMLNFIGTSVSYKKKEIGILRAIGASGRDVQGIFVKEATIIALIQVFIAIVVTAGTMIYLNSKIYDAVSIKLLDFGLIQIGIMLLIALSVAYLSSAIPVLGIARKKPIDAIRDK